MTGKTIAIIGAGPIGLEAAHYARQLGHAVVVYERGAVAANVESWAFVRLFSPWKLNTTPLGRRALAQPGRWTDPPSDECPTGEEFRARYLLPLAELVGECIRTQTQVIAVGKDDYSKSEAIGSVKRAESPFRILVRDASGNERIDHADVVLDCSGVYGNHRWAGRGGVPAPGERELESQIWYTIPDVLGEDRARFADRHTLLIGAGHSAATVLTDIEALCRDHPRTRLTWAIRRPGQALQTLLDDPLPMRRESAWRCQKLQESPPPWLQFLGTCVLEQVSRSDRFEVTLRSMQTNFALTVDEIAALVGYRPDSSIYEQLQIHQCYATGGPMHLAAALLAEEGGDCLTAGAGITADTMKNPEPNFYLLGAKSYGTNSNFLLLVGHRQVRDVFRLIQGEPELDLYATDRERNAAT